MKTRITILSIILDMGLGFNPECSGQLTLTTDSIFQTSTCAGGNIYVLYTVSGGSYVIGNTFTAQLSDGWGDFSNPTNISSLPFWSTAVIAATIPIDATLGIFYKVRVIANNPIDTGSVSPNNVIVTTPPSEVATIIANPNDTICQGDSIILSVPIPADSYLWSPGGEINQSITVTQAGSYTVTVTHFPGCETTSDPIDVVVEIYTGISENNSRNSVTIYPNPNTGQFTLTLPPNQLNSSFVLYDLPGKEIIHIGEINETKIKISVNNIPDGIYIYNIINGHNIIGAGKLIINKTYH